MSVEQPREKFAPSTAPVGLAEKARESVELLRYHWTAARRGDDFDWLFDDVAAYDGALRAHAGRELRDSRVLEVGFGARPYRMIALLAMGVDARGVQDHSQALWTLLNYELWFNQVVDGGAAGAPAAAAEPTAL